MGTVARFITLAALTCSVGCSDDAPRPGVTADGGASPSDGSSAGAEPLANGRWVSLFSGVDGDFPNSYPRVDGDAAGAQLLYVAKANNLVYYRFPSAGVPSTVPFPPFIKNPGELVVTPSRTVILTRELFNGDTGSLLVTGDEQRPGPPPFPPGATRTAPTGARLGADVVAAAAVDEPTPALQVRRLAGDAWSTMGEVPARGVAHLSLDGDGDGGAAVLHALESSGVRHVWRVTAAGLADLGAPPASAGSALTAAAIDGPRTYFLEYLGDNRSTVWVHDGVGWSLLVRSEEGESFHSLGVHRGGLYTFSADLPNGVSLTTRAIARLEQGRVTRIPFDGQSDRANIDPNSRVDVMRFERSYLVSRGGVLYMAYEELGTPAFIHLYRFEPR